MAVYDLEEQEKIDDLKAFWKRWGNAISGAVIAVRGAPAEPPPLARQEAEPAAAKSADRVKPDAIPRDQPPSQSSTS